MGLYGQFPGGGFAGDENCRPGYRDPRQGFETCGIVEFMHSFEMLDADFRQSPLGRPLRGDRLQLPAGRPDARPKALHYLTGANMVQFDRGNKSPGIQNGGTMLSYSPRRLPLLPAQPRHGLAVLCRGAVAGHGRQRAVRVALRGLAK